MYFLKIVDLTSCFVRPIVRMHGEWVSWRKRRNDSVERLLGVWPLLRHVDSWKRWSQKGWPRRMGQDWCARRRKRSSSGCCPCGPRVHPSSRLVRARVKLFPLLKRVWYFARVKVSDAETVWNLFYFFFFFNTVRQRKSGFDGSVGINLRSDWSWIYLSGKFEIWLFFSFFNQIRSLNQVKSDLKLNRKLNSRYR